MNKQVIRWFQASGAVVGTFVLLNAVDIYEQWQMVHGFDGDRPVVDLIWAQWNAQLFTLGAQVLGILVLLALTAAISRFLLRGRFVIVVGAALLVITIGIAEWFAFDGGIEGPESFAFGLLGIFDSAALAMAAGGWMLRPRASGAGSDRISPEILGVWDTPGGVLVCESDGVFTLTRANGSTTAGLWEPLPGPRPQLVLKVASETGLGHGWQATVLDLELEPYGAVLRAGTARYRRREAEAALERSTGCVGAVEILEG